MPKGVYVRTKPVWNKGLTKEDSRVAKNAESRKATMIERYGSLSYNNKEKRIKTNNERYGVDYNFQTGDKEKRTLKRKETCLKKYGVEIASKNDTVKNKAKQTFKNNHNGFNNNFSLPNVREKINLSLKTEQVKEKRKQTCLEKYGVTSISKLETCKNKVKETKLRNFGDPNYNNKEKEYQTRKANGSFNKHKTKDEIQVEESLLRLFDKDDIIYQYRSEKYPFIADFYIKSIDTYIEVQGNWTHGDHPFDKNNQADIDILNKWINKNSGYYKNAIYTWTDLDVRKIETAKRNNIKLILIYKNNNVIII